MREELPEEGNKLGARHEDNQATQLWSKRRDRTNGENKTNEGNKGTNMISNGGTNGGGTNGGPSKGTNRGQTGEIKQGKKGSNWGNKLGEQAG